MFLEALIWWGIISLIILTLGILFEINEFLKDKDPDDKILKNILGNKFYNFLNKIL